MRRFWIASALTLTIALVLAACGSGTAAPATGEPAKPASAPTAMQQAASPTPTVETTVGAEPTAVGTTLTLQSRDAGLDKLKSYRVTWKAEWQTTKDGKTDQAMWDWLQEYTADPVARRTVWKGTGASGKEPGSLEIWGNGSVESYVAFDPQGTQTCSYQWSPMQRTIPGTVFSPGMLGKLSGAEYSGTEVVNGIRSNHYKYDEKAANRTDLGQMSGDIWIAADNGYVVKDIVNWEGGPVPFGSSGASGETGTGSWTWELTDPNGAITVPPMPGCDSATNALPLPSGSYQRTITGDVMDYLIYHPEKVLAFYQQEMPNAGWKQSGDLVTKGQVATVEFTKDDQKVSVTITTTGLISEVKVEVTKQQ